MSRELEKVLGKLEAAVGEWTKALGSGPAPSPTPSGAPTPPGAAAPASPTPDATAQVADVLERIRAGLEAIHGALTEGTESTKSATQRMDRLDAAMEGLHEEYRRMREMLQGDLARLDALLTQPAEEEKSESELARELARALRDRDEAHQEIVRLRCRVEAFEQPALPDADERVPRPAAATGSDSEDISPVLDVFDRQGNRRRIGDILVEASGVTPDQLEEAIEAQRQEPHRRLGSILAEKGYVSDDLIAQLVALQIGLPFVRLDSEPPDDTAARLITRRLAVHHECIPIRATDDQLVLAMANPLDLVAIEDIELATDRRVDPVVAAPSSISAAITRCYGPSYTA